MDNNRYSFDETSTQDVKGQLPESFERVLAKGIAWAWRLSGDRQAVASLLGRYSAHLGIVVLVVLMALFGRITLARVSVAEVSDVSDVAEVTFSVAAEPVATPTITRGTRSWQAPVQNAIARQAMPHTEIPDRVRLEVITYTVQPNDTVTGIAEKFELSPYTIVWSNMETLQGAPWLIQPGLVLDIPPVDGAYHTVADGESVESIAEDYEVEPLALHNMWNSIEDGDSLREGQFLVVPGGVGEDFDWEPPPPPPAQPGVASASYSSGVCGNVNVSGPGANGWFTLPTGSYAVSGWTFADPRNPRHIGLDYRCRSGDPIYAADNGVVVFSGWGGGYGNLVRVDHGNGYQTYYAHFSAIYVGCGEPVYQGQVLGACGTTGYSTGPHLHYEIRLNGVPQNPSLFEP